MTRYRLFVASQQENEGERLGARLRQAGFDLTQSFDTEAFNCRNPEGFRLQAFGRPNALGVLVGHTKGIWPAFLKRYRDLAALRTSRDPLDEYTELCVAEALEGASARYEVHFGHHGEPEYVPLQRLAAFAGLAELAPCHLSVHETHGPWIALRAVVVFDRPAPTPPARRPISHCRQCSRPCLPALTRALEHRDPRQGESYLAAWLGVREACPVGQRSRYTDLQVRYHYLKDPQALSELATLPTTNSSLDRPVGRF